MKRRSLDLIAFLVLLIVGPQAIGLVYLFGAFSFRSLSELNLLLFRSIELLNQCMLSILCVLASKSDPILFIHGAILILTGMSRFQSYH